MKTTKRLFLFFILTLIIMWQEGKSQDIIFLHHSTGNNVFKEGNVAAWISNYNSDNKTSYNLVERSYPNTPYPWQNYPYDYWNLWINNACNNAQANIECLDELCKNFDVIVLKHCFPGADILADESIADVGSSVKTIANYKLQYRALRGLFDSYPQNKFIVWTLTPRHRLATKDAYSARVRQFVDWVKNEWLTEDGKSHPNIYIFDFFGLVAELNSNPTNGKVNCLKYDFERSHTDNDSHPNTLANQTVGPIFAEFIVNSINSSLSSIKVTNISISSSNGSSEIVTTSGTLQLEASILPDNAENKSITWTIVNGTGKATINSSGLVTAVSDGLVTAVATANDNSGITGTYEITISNQTITNISGSNNSDNDDILNIQMSGKSLKVKPVNDDLIIEYYTLTTMQGYVTEKKKISNNLIDLDLSSYSPGIYILSITNQGALTPLKIVVY